MDGLPQTPFRQMSLNEQETPSSHAIPLGLARLTQFPVAGSHTPSLHWSPVAEQSFSTPPPQVPCWQIVFDVQALPSSQRAPSRLSAYWHCPVAALQMP